MYNTDELIGLVRWAVEFVDGVTSDYDELAMALEAGNMAEAAELARDLSFGADEYVKAVTAMHNAVSTAAGG